MYIKIFPYVNSWFSLHFSQNQRNPVAGRHKKNLVFNKIKLHVNLFFILETTNWRRPFLYLIYNNICSYFHSDWIISLAIGVAILYLKKQTNKHKNQTTTITTTTKQSKGRNFCSSWFYVKSYLEDLLGEKLRGSHNSIVEKSSFCMNSKRYFVLSIRMV